MNLCAYAYMYIYVCMYVCMQVGMHACMFIFVQTVCYVHLFGYVRV